MVSSSTVFVLCLLDIMFTCSNGALYSRNRPGTRSLLQKIDINSQRKDNGIHCPPWYKINSTEQGMCVCRKHQSIDVLKCTDQGALLEFGYCMTYDEDDGEYTIGECPYFQSNGHNLTEDGYVKLPDNVSQLNDYMCHTMNRKGLLCSQCIDGFGPAMTSTGFKCTNCTDVWYGVPLYLMVKLVPITIIYLVIPISRINITSAPMTCFIMYNELILHELLYNRTPPLGRLVYQLHGIKLQILLLVYGITNLEFIQYLVPSFCVGNKHMFTFILEYLLAFYPLCLIILTWICIELHGRNFRPLVWLWRPLHKCFVQLRRKWDTTNDLIDVFASFLLLSYTNIVYQSLLFIDCQKIVYTHDFSKVNSRFVMFFDWNGTCGSIKHITIIIPAIIIICIFNLLPALLLVLYPIRAFRACLTKCRLNGIAITTFVEKFHSCCRDGLDGGQDMRSFSGFYFILRLFLFIGNFISECFLPGYWSMNTLLFLTLALLIALIKPYKKTYMHVFDTISLATLAVLCHLMTYSRFISPGTDPAIFTAIGVIPGLLVAFLTCWKAIRKVLSKKTKQTKEHLIRCFSWCKHPLSHIVTHTANNQSNSYETRDDLPQPMIPTISYGSYGSTDYH